MGQIPSPAKLGHSLGRGEWETTQDTMEDLSWEKDDDYLTCGVLGEVETALGSSILVLAVSGPEYAISTSVKWIFRLGWDLRISTSHETGLRNLEARECVRRGYV